MDITLAFKKLSLTNGDEITLSIAPSAMDKMILELTDNGYLTTEEMATYVISQIKNCDKRNLPYVLPESVLKKLNETYQTVNNGD
ncbi:hypothetical protein EJP617_26450 [Erwinia sp. Ejp617]|nr:hypothetical protein [Erwinia sp. Ejp617]ADP12326.1 hypothetical protein EJP617_26450 [Erwinia sp. Ejp617]